MKSLKKLGYLSCFLLPFWVILGYNLGGYWNFLCIGLIFIVVPILDFFVGGDAENVEDTQMQSVSDEKFYRYVTYTWVYVQVAMIFWGAYIFVAGNLTPILLFGFLSGIAQISGGIGITVAHELGHQKSEIERFYSKVLLMTVCYMHFYIEHNRGHHVHVATPLDPATSRKDENFYLFWYRSVTDGWISAWKIETTRLQKKNVSIWSYENEMLRFTALPILFCIVLLAAVSLYTGQIQWGVPVFFFVQSVMGFSLLEIINYIEHYGILRRQTAEGRYERVNPIHSWNSNQVISNFFLFQLQRHSDHHANATRRYQVLRHFEESPQLPNGYPAMIWMALFPPIWKKVMNNRLEKWEEKRNLVMMQN
jgi:alkane 1-monooxygenase